MPSLLQKKIGPAWTCLNAVCTYARTSVGLHCLLPAYVMHSVESKVYLVTVTEHQLYVLYMQTIFPVATPLPKFRRVNYLVPQPLHQRPDDDANDEDMSPEGEVEVMALPPPEDEAAEDAPGVVDVDVSPPGGAEAAACTGTNCCIEIMYGVQE